LIGALAFFGLRLWPKANPAGGEARLARAVAVLDFENDTNDPSLAWMGRGIAQLLGTALSHSHDLAVYGAQRLMNLAPGAQSGGELATLRRHGIGRAIVGSVLRSGQRLMIQGRVMDVASGRVLHSESVEGAVGDDLFQLTGGLMKGLQA